MRRVGVFIAAAMLLVGTGCKDKTPKPAEGQPTTTDKPDSGTAAPSKTAGTILSQSTALALLPPETVAALAIEGMGPLTQRIGLETVKTRYAPAYAALTKELTKELGVNPFDPAALAEAGLDPQAPMGVALISMEPMTAVGWIGMSDATKAETWVKAMYAKNGVAEPSRSTQGDRIVLTASDGPGFVLAGNVLLVVMADDDAAAAATEALAKREAKASLAESAAFKVAMKDLPRGGSLAVYGQASQALAMLLDLPPGATDTLLGQDGILAGGGDDTGPAGEMALRWRAKGSAPLLAPFRALKSPHAILRATKRSPLVLLGGAVDMAEIKSTLSAVATLSGLSEKELAEGLKADLGLDLDKDIFSLLSGEMGFSFTLERFPDMEKDKDGDFLAEQSHGHLVVGVTDEKRAAEVLALLAKPMGWEADNGRFRTTISGWRAVTIGVAGGYVVASSETATFDRMTGTETVAAGLSNPRLKALATGTGYAGIGLLDLRAAGWLMLATSMEGHMGSDDPEVKKLNAEIQARHETLEAKLNQGSMDVMAAFGAVAGTLTPADGGFDATLGLYYGKSNAAEVIEAAAGMVTKRRTVWRDEGRAIDALRAKVRKLLNGDAAARPGAQVAPPDTVAPVAVTPALTLTGTLRYTEIAARKSVQAYNGVEFILDAGDRRTALRPGSVTRELLLAHKDKQVTVVCTMGKPTMPRPEESHPVGLHGEPIPRPAKCAVNSITPATP